MLDEIKESISEVLDLFPGLTSVPSSLWLGENVESPPLPSSLLPPDDSTNLVAEGGTSNSDAEMDQVFTKRPQVIEGVRSPYSSAHVISIDDIRLMCEQQDPVVKEYLLGDGLSIPLLKLKEMGGLVARKALEKKQVTQGTPLWNEVMEFFTGVLGGRKERVDMIYDIEEAGYRTMFEGHRKSLYQKQDNSPEFFNKKDYLTMREAGLRSEYLRFLEKKYAATAISDHSSPSLSSRLLMNGDPEERKTRTVLMVHGTSDAIGWKIAQGGFGIVGSVDAGFYGNGMYFSSKADYGAFYAENQARRSDPKGREVLLIAAVNPGNVFPVLEHKDSPGSMIGKPCRPGYQSHYCVVGKGFHPVAKIDDENARDELVVFEVAQALPLFMVNLK